MNDLDNNKLLELYPNYTSVLGPYKRKDGRKHVVLNNSNASKGTRGKTKTISYPKALIEAKIGKRLEENQTIDHHDRNFLNDDENNLKIKDRSTHSSEDALRVQVDLVNCPICNKSFEPNQNQRNKKLTVAGPFCSKQCSGKYGTLVQNEKVKLERIKINKRYYKKVK
jgi:hypothetical protein